MKAGVSTSLAVSPVTGARLSRRDWGLLAAAVLLAGCSSAPRKGSGPAPVPSPQALNLDGELREALLARTMLVVNTPYTYGGNSPEGGFDCSGLVGYVFRSALGIELPRVSREMAHDDNAELINDRTALAAGDLVFFGRKGRVDHVGIYVGDGRFLHAPSSGKDVRVDTLLSGYWGNKFMQARRVDL